MEYTIQRVTVKNGEQIVLEEDTTEFDNPLALVETLNKNNKKTGTWVIK